MKYRIATLVTACLFAGAVGAAGTADKNTRSSTSQAFESLDVNGDGFISKDEAGSSTSRVNKSWKTLDKNMDGKVSKAEYDSGGGSSEGPESGSSGSGTSGSSP